MFHKKEPNNVMITQWELYPICNQSGAEEGVSVRGNRRGNSTSIGATTEAEIRRGVVLSFQLVGPEVFLKSPTPDEAFRRLHH